MFSGLIIKNNSRILTRTRNLLINRNYSSSMSKRGLVLGLYSSESDGKDDLKLTKFGENYNASVSGKLLEQINM